MTDVESFLESPESTREEIMRATYLALCEHGYADLTVQRIGDQFPKSNSLVYHHYDSKDGLLLDFLGFMLDRFEEEMPFEDVDDPGEHLDAVLDHVFATPLPDERREFVRAMVELRAQAANDERYREQFTRHDRFFTERIAAIVDAGIERGVFQSVDADAVATLLVTTINGSMTQRVTSAETVAATVREQTDSVVRALLEGE